uniref:transcription initiation factor TFIID subunit 11-like n=1 Tax=Erigeron canadensis TaxID=72917 RepID=UPI001CB936A3|nr:transcription initiation factor TFIID subunit 11-like [Erigeron canadensis]
MDDSQTRKKRSSVAVSKDGTAKGASKEKLKGLGDQLDKSQRSNLTQPSKLQPVPAMKRKFQKTTITGTKTPSVYNLRSNKQITEDAKDPPAYNLRTKVQKTGGQNTSTPSQKRKTSKNEKSKDSSEAIQTGILKNTSPPDKKIETTKPVTTSPASLDKKNEPITSQYEPFLCEPMYHIRWEGDEMENRPFGQNCIVCNKDLSGVTEDDDSEDNDDDRYEYDEDDDDYEYYDDVTPPLLPAVDILACGHAYHTECLQQGMSEQQSSEPQCILCSKKA